MKEKDISKVTGFRFEIFNIFIIVFTVIVAIVLSFVVYMAHSTYEEFYDATKEYIACRTAAEDIHEASDYLTKQVRNFAYTGNLTSLKNYFKEANVDKRRQKALETIDSYLNEDVKKDFLESAVNYSFQLMNIEYHSMRLVLEANGVDMDLYPEEVLNHELTSAEKAMSNEEKIELAKVLVSSTTYDNYKDNIYNSVSTYTKELLSETEKREQENSALFSKYQQIQMILIIVLLCDLLITVAFTSMFLIRPLRRNSKLIVNKDLLPVKGPAEMRTFAALYNKVLEKTKIQQEKLTYDASHDSLTGIQNRSIFDEMYHSIDTTDHISLAIIDIDHFKSINDTHGHEIGDGVLKWLASILHSSFRSDDIICRIGGDEFTVILRGVTSENEEHIREKMEHIMKLLSEKKDNLPTVTVSIGVAFGTTDLSFKDLYKNADKALYKIKSTSRNGVEFYTE